MKPVILITPSRDAVNDRYKKRYQLACLYAECVRLAGAVPLLACGGDARDYAALADGILFSGGCDVHPARYGESILNETVAWDAERDAEELALFDAFYAANKPIFGICRGIQLINVALGGTLWQDIPAQVAGTYVHSGNTTHTVQLTDGSCLSEVFQTPVVTVNSYHHQAIKTPGAGLRVSAVSDDGIIEGVESENGQILAVQWHPERITLPDMLEDRDDMTPFFHEMVKRTVRNKR